ncbi:hypothetical protein A9K55_000863 [Cordyceps militaris]|uniref:Uncharacterized protein n=1 Tax=Cordyceps militaris TaxID=73501 RepID=A0A2H4SUV6_CORMI|nr:hypothetical protein A9K55_000863 [Cordyceps militaris]
MARTWLRGTDLRTAFRGAPGLKTHTPQGEKIQRRDKREPVSPDRWDAYLPQYLLRHGRTGKHGMRDGTSFTCALVDASAMVQISCVDWTTAQAPASHTAPYKVLGCLSNACIQLCCMLGVDATDDQDEDGHGLKACNATKGSSRGSRQDNTSACQVHPNTSIFTFGPSLGETGNYPQYDSVCAGPKDVG